MVHLYNRFILLDIFIVSTFRTMCSHSVKLEYITVALWPSYLTSSLQAALQWKESLCNTTRVNTKAKSRESLLHLMRRRCISLQPSKMCRLPLLDLLSFHYLNLRGEERERRGRGEGSVGRDLQRTSSPTSWPLLG